MYHKNTQEETYIEYREGVHVEEKQFDACMERMRSGDKNALHEIYEAYLGYIYSIVLQIVSKREDAEDVTSEFFMKLWRLADTYRGGNGHRAWMAAIARNMAVDLLDRKSTRLNSSHIH